MPLTLILNVCFRLKNGYNVTVYSRTKAKAESVLAEGATWAANPKEVASKSEVVITMVGFPSDVEETILNPKSGVLAVRRSPFIPIEL